MRLKKIMNVRETLNIKTGKTELIMKWIIAWYKKCLAKKEAAVPKYLGRK